MKASLKLSRSNNGNYDIEVDMISSDGIKHNFYRSVPFIENLYTESYQEYNATDIVLVDAAVLAQKWVEEFMDKHKGEE